jgi:hypothetical protein
VWTAVANQTGTGGAPTIQSDNALDPSGALIADTISIPARSALTRSQVISQNVNIASTATMTGSIYLQAATAGDIGKQVDIYMYNTTGSAVVSVVSVILTAQYQRVSVTGSLASGASQQVLAFGRLGSGFGSTNQDLVAISFNACWAQGEVGSVATPFIHNTTAITTVPSASWSYTRSGTQIDSDSASIAVSSNTDQLPISNLGLSVWETRVNKCINYNLSPTDLTGVSQVNFTLSVAPVATLPQAVKDALAASSIGGLGITNVYRAVTSGSGFASDRVIIAGPTGNVNTHTVSMYAYVVSGVPRINIVNSSAAGAALNLNSGWARTSLPVVAPAADGTARIFATGSGVTEFYFILNQLEEGAYPTPPIVVAGATGTRGPPVPALTGLNYTSATPFTIYIDCDTNSISQLELFAFFGSTDNTGIALLRTTTSNRVYSSGYYQGSNSAAAIFNNVAAGTKIKMAVYVLGSTVRASLNGQTVATGTIDSATYTLGYQKLYVGEWFSNNLHANGNIRNVKIIPGERTDTDLQNMTK